MYNKDTSEYNHSTYLKEFRAEQCQLFLQHKCTQHRPYSCFHWHFMNQRRRRPLLNRNGTYNYNPDVYCDSYDEQTGICSNGDDCPYVHRNAGDTERRYHPRYYKTAWCVYETDAKGHCVKNGPHCAYAHSTADARSDFSELKDVESSFQRARYLSMSLEKDKALNDDPRWNDSHYVLENYKTELCKRPPRMCRQGYACPQFHNPRDRRRNPYIYKYRSTPCPNVKQGDEWGEPSLCENSDNCKFCHSRTEQQFHPEIYKSTKCNDILFSNYCPRGSFCAFAHAESELKSHREHAGEHLGDMNLTSILDPSSPDSFVHELSGSPSKESFHHSENSASPSSDPLRFSLRKNIRQSRLQAERMKAQSHFCGFSPSESSAFRRVSASPLYRESLSKTIAKPIDIPLSHSYSGVIPTFSRVDYTDSSEEIDTQFLNRQESLEAMISRSLENIGLENAEFTSDSDDQIERKNSKLLPSSFPMKSVPTGTQYGTNRSSISPFEPLPSFPKNDFSNDSGIGRSLAPEFIAATPPRTFLNQQGQNHLAAALFENERLRDEMGVLRQKVSTLKAYVINQRDTMKAMKSELDEAKCITFRLEKERDEAIRQRDELMSHFGMMESTDHTAKEVESFFSQEKPQPNGGSATDQDSNIPLKRSTFDGS